MPIRTEHAAQVAEVRAAYERYLAAFMANDMDAINALVRYPLAYLGDGQVTVLDAYPIKPAELMARTGWRDTVNMQYDVVAISDSKAHVVLRSGTRVRADGSPIEEVSAFYAWTRTAGGWKMFAVSDIATPLPS